MEMAVLVHQTHVGNFTVGAEFACGVNGEQHACVLASIRAEFLAAVANRPFVAIADDEIAGCRHDSPRCFETRWKRPRGKDGSSGLAEKSLAEPRRFRATRRNLDWMAGKIGYICNFLSMRP
jgi:hypothetical protein